MINRIERVKNHYGLSTRAFAIKCGMNQPTLDRMLKGINAVNLNCILSILNTFPEISEEWLLKGTGSMLKADIRDAENHRISKLLDTITTLQEAINYKSDIIATLTEKINNLENQLKNK